MCWWFVCKQVDCTSGFSVGSKNHGWSADSGAATGQKGYLNNGPGNAVATGWSSLSQWGLGETGSWIFYIYIYLYIYSSTQPRWLNLPSLYHQRFRRLGSKIPDALNVVFCSGSNISSNVACRQQFSTWFHGFVDDLQMPCQNMPWNHLCVLSASRLEFLFVSQMNFELYPPVCPLLSRSIGSTGLPWNDAITIQILSSPPEIWHVSNITRPVDWTWNFERSCPPGQLLGSLWVSEILVIPKAEIDWQHFSVWECEWPRNALETGGVSSWKMCGGTFLGGKTGTTPHLKPL